MALENARLIDETRQRAAELAIVNSVGQALAGQLDLDTLIAAPGRPDARDVRCGPRLRGAPRSGPRRDRVRLLQRRRRARGRTRRSRYGEGLTSQVLQIATTAPAQPGGPVRRSRGSGRRQARTSGCRSSSATRPSASISVQDTTQNGRFGEADSRLLATLAANVGVAIQNARLYRDAQRQAAEMTALAEVGRGDLGHARPRVRSCERITDRARQTLLAGRHERGLPGRGGRPHLPPDRGPGLVRRRRSSADTIELGEGIIGDLARRGDPETSTTSRSDARTIDDRRDRGGRHRSTA